MSEEIKFTKEQIDYAKHCLEHFEVLTGGRGHSKTKQIIEQLQQENQQLKSVLNEVREVLNYCIKHYGVHNMTTKDFDALLEILDKVGGSNE